MAARRILAALSFRLASRALPAAIAAAALMLAACSAPAQNPDLAVAQGAEAGGRHDTALAAYQAAQQSCRRQTSPRRRQASCTAAYLGRAELLERMGKTREAAAAYAAIPAALAADPGPSATATYRAGKLHLELDDDERAYTLLWQTITDYPDQPAAGDALRLVVRDGRRRNPRQLYQTLATLLQHLSGTAAGDNLLHIMADVAEHDLDDARAALGLYDKLTVEYPRSGLRDDAWWHGARLARGLGDGAGAARRLQALLATREVAVGVGSYFSVWLDDAQLELGRVLRDDLGNPRAALAAFARLPRDYPASVLIDDALWETALTWERLGDRAQTCAALARLASFVDSKYLLERAPALAAASGCSGVSQ